jgi:hypothetical protein
MGEGNNLLSQALSVGISIQEAYSFRISQQKKSFNFSTILPISEFGTPFAFNFFWRHYLISQRGGERDENTHCRR